MECRHTSDKINNIIDLLQGNPQYLFFFYEWYNSTNATPSELDEYLKHIPSEIEKLQIYLMKNLYHALGGSQSNHNKLLKAISFPRIPIDKNFLEKIFAKLTGSEFSETLYELNILKNLILEIKDGNATLYTIHDLLREFYYQLTDNKSDLHKLCGFLYREKNNENELLANNIEGAHHFMKAKLFQDSAEMILPIWYYCTTFGYYWKELKHILDHIDYDHITDEQVFSHLTFAYASLCFKMSEWDKAIEFYNKSLEVFEKVGDVHGMAQTYNNLGLVYQAKGEWDKAIEFYNKSLEGKEKVGDVHGMAHTFGNLGVIDFSNGKHKQAISRILEVFLIFTKMRALAEIKITQNFLASFKKELPESEFELIFKESLDSILKKGIKWGNIVVLSPENVRSVLENILNAK